MDTSKVGAFIIEMYQMRLYPQLLRKAKQLEHFTDQFTWTFILLLGLRILALTLARILLAVSSLSSLTVAPFALATSFLLRMKWDLVTSWDTALTLGTP